MKTHLRILRGCSAPNCCISEGTQHAGMMALWTRLFALSVIGGTEATASRTLLSSASVSQFSFQEQSLRTQLLQNYERQVPPMSNTSSTTVVHASVQVFDLYSVDLGAGTINLGASISLSWLDTRLRWDPNDWTYTNGGTTYKIEQMHFAVAAFDKSRSEIYAPQFDLLDLAAPLHDSFSDNLAAVAYNGSVSWTRSGQLKAICALNTKDFPDINSECSIQLGS